MAFAGKKELKLRHLDQKQDRLKLSNGERSRYMIP